MASSKFCEDKNQSTLSTDEKTEMRRLIDDSLSPGCKTQMLEINKTKRLKKSSSSKYNLEYLMSICPTSCDAERLFSKSKYFMTPNRTRMTSKTFEDRMILAENCRDWWMNEFFWSLDETRWTWTAEILSSY